MHSGNFGHLRLKMWASSTDSFLINNVYYRKYIKVTKLEVPSNTRLQKKNKLPDKRGYRGPLGPPLNLPLSLLTDEQTESD